MICSRAFCSESRHALRSCSVVLPPIKLTIARAAARQVSSMSICGMSARVLSVEPHIMATTAAAITTALWFRGGSLQNHRSTGPRRSINFPSQTTRLGSSATDNRTADLIRQSLEVDEERVLFCRTGGLHHSTWLTSSIVSDCSGADGHEVAPSLAFAA